MGKSDTPARKTFSYYIINGGTIGRHFIASAPSLFIGYIYKVLGSPPNHEDTHINTHVYGIAHEAWMPIAGCVGDYEATSKEVKIAIRRGKEGKLGEMAVQRFLKEIFPKASCRGK